MGGMFLSGLKEVSQVARSYFQGGLTGLWFTLPRLCAPIQLVRRRCQVAWYLLSGPSCFGLKESMWQERDRKNFYFLSLQRHLNTKEMFILVVKYGSLSLVDRVPFNSASILGNQWDSGKMSLLCKGKSLATHLIHFLHPTFCSFIRLS